MFLKNLALINFKCHQNLKLDFTCTLPKQPIRKTTIILGENGTGKSAVLKAIALVTAGSNALSSLLNNSDTWIQNKKTYCEIKATLVTAQKEERQITLHIEKGQTIFKILEYNKISLEQIDEALKHTDRNYFVLGYGASRRLNSGDNRIESKQDYIKSPRYKAIQTLFNADAALVSLTNWAMDLDYKSNGANVDVVKKALNQFLVENVKFKSIDKQKGQLIFSTMDGDIPLEQLSDGYQNVAAWVGDLIFNITNTFKDHKDPLKARGLLLVDEVDLHLHPIWQRRLHAFLNVKLPNFQIIVTSHSPLTAQQAKENELFALCRNNKKVELVPFIGNPSALLLHQILMSPVFGLFSDESVEVENTKKRVREISLKKTKTAKEKVEIKKLMQNTIPLSLNIRSNSNLDPKDIDLLKTLNQKLKIKLK
jgi:predicted ATP-binding protein involved in virulence